MQEKLLCQSCIDKRDRNGGHKFLRIGMKQLPDPGKNPICNKNTIVRRKDNVKYGIFKTECHNGTENYCNNHAYKTIAQLVKVFPKTLRFVHGD